MSTNRLAKTLQRPCLLLPLLHQDCFLCKTTHWVSEGSTSVQRQHCGEEKELRHYLYFGTQEVDVKQVRFLLAINSAAVTLQSFRNLLPHNTCRHSSNGKKIKCIQTHAGDFKEHLMRGQEGVVISPQDCCHNSERRSNNLHRRSSVPTFALHHTTISTGDFIVLQQRYPR